MHCTSQAGSIAWSGVSVIARGVALPGGDEHDRERGQHDPDDVAARDALAEDVIARITVVTG